jgi:cobalt-zinc-cadmium efflux system protein
VSSRGRLVLALVLSAGVAGLEFWGGAAAHSLALTTDAVHVCMDVLALAIAVLAAIGATRRANKRKTFGYGRLEVLGALVNGALLLGATALLAYQAVLRFSAPLEPRGALMTIVAAIGFTVNVSAALLLRHDHHAHDHNMRAALMHVVSDALGAIVVLVGGVLIAFTGAAWIDPLLSLIVAVIIVAGVAGVLRDASDVLLESTPPGIDADDVARAFKAIPGVEGVHDLHVWMIATGSNALSAHVMLDDRRLSEAAKVLDDVRGVAERTFGITHVTVQLECERCDPGQVMICHPERSEA